MGTRTNRCAPNPPARPRLPDTTAEGREGRAISSLIVEVCRVDAVEPHPNADRMAVARIKGWQVCVAKNADGQPWCQAGDAVVYFPPDTVLPPDVAEKHGVTKYLGPLPKREDGTRPPGGRVMVANLRGFKSYGFLAPPDDPEWEVGHDVAAHYGATKYEPPVRASAGDAERPNPAFHRYFDMENVRNFPDLIAPGDEVVVTEKIHGENCRLGLIREAGADGVVRWTWATGSHDVRRKRFTQKVDAAGNAAGPPAESVFWRCFTPEAKALLCELTGCGLTPDQVDAGADATTGADAVLFGERFGSGVQDLWYGHQNGRFAFRAFDAAVGGRYLDADAKAELFARRGVPAAPVLYRGPYDFAAIEPLAEGATTVADGGGIREGVVIVTAQERPAVTPKRVMERAQAKLIGFAYLSRKGGTEYK